MSTSAQPTTVDHLMTLVIAYGAECRSAGPLTDDAVGLRDEIRDRVAGVLAERERLAGWVETLARSAEEGAADFAAVGAAGTAEFAATVARLARDVQAGGVR
jgi:hypothetical protein